MSLFLSLGFLIFSLLLAFYLFPHKEAFWYLLIGLLGLLSFLTAWLLLYLLKALYCGLLGYELLSTYTALDFFFKDVLLLSLPLLLLSYTGLYLFNLFYPKIEKLSSSYFWFSGFFSSFCIYILFQASARYYLFEYLLLPFLIISYFNTLIYSLFKLQQAKLSIKLTNLVLIGTLFSLPSVYWQALYFKTSVLFYALSILLGLLSLFFLCKLKSPTFKKENKL